MMCPQLKFAITSFESVHTGQKRIQRARKVGSRVVACTLVMVAGRGEGRGPWRVRWCGARTAG